MGLVIAPVDKYYEYPHRAHAMRPYKKDVVDIG